MCVDLMDVLQSVLRAQLEFEDDSQQGQAPHDDQSPFGQGRRSAPRKAPMDQCQEEDHGVQGVMELHQVFLLGGVEPGEGALRFRCQRDKPSQPSDEDTERHGQIGHSEAPGGYLSRCLVPLIASLSGQPPSQSLSPPFDTVLAGPLPAPLMIIGHAKRADRQEAAHKKEAHEKQDDSGPVRARFHSGIPSKR